MFLSVPIQNELNLKDALSDLFLFIMSY